MTKFLRRTGLVAALVLSLGLAACGAAPDGSRSGSGGDTAAAQQALQVAYDGELGAPPTTPTTAPPGVDLWVVSCGQQVQSCVAPAAAVQDAAEKVGWDVTICDGQLNPDGWGTCVRQATSAGADVIIPIGIDCPAIQQPFQEAQDAGVTVVGGGGVSCEEVGGPKLWASPRLQLEGLSSQQLYNLQGRLAADWLIGKTDGTAQVLALEFTDPVWGPWINEGFESEMATCSGCSIVSTLEFTNQDLIGGLAQKFSTSLLQAVSADSVFLPIGGVMGTGVAQAIVSSGRSAELNVITGQGDQSNLDLIRGDGGQDAIVGYPIEWGGWGSVDTAIRVLNGETVQVQGDGYEVVDSDHNLPAEGQPFSGGVDFEAAYSTTWGI